MHKIPFLFQTPLQIPGKKQSAKLAITNLWESASSFFFFFQGNRLYEMTWAINRLNTWSLHFDLDLEPTLWGVLAPHKLPCKECMMNMPYHGLLSQHHL